MADVITRLRVESSEYDSKIKRASQGLLQMEQACRKVGGTLAVVEKDELDFVRSLGKMETVSRDARGQIGELTKAFTDLSMMYKRLTDEEKNSPYGRALTASLGELKTRIQDTKNDLASINQELSGSKFGQFGGLIDSVGQKMGINANITELLTSKTALMTAGIGAGIAIVGQAADAWARYNQELSRQDQVTNVTTGLKGPAANAMTDAARAVADTYGVDFREVINAANTLMTQFGQSGSQAMHLIRDGMQGMIMGDGPKLLSMIQQYAPSFRDAGISASQLIAIIHNSEGGIFTDQNMNAIVMGIKNIRLMTNQTSEALAKMGIDGAEMTRKLNDGTMTVFEALGQVSNAIERTGSGSQAAGEVMQYVFGRQGAVSGTKLGEAIATLNTNLNETKRQTGDLGVAFAELQTANERLNKAIREAFEYDGWEQMTVGIKTGLLDALSSVLETTIKIKESWVGDVGKTIFSAIGSAALETMGVFGRLLNVIRQIKSEVSDTGNGPTGVGLGGDLMKHLPERVRRPVQEVNALRKVEDAPARQEAHRQNLSRYDAQITAQQQKISALGDSSLVPEIQEAIEGEKKRLKELQQMRETYAREAEKILAPKVEVMVETQDATARIKELTAKLKELREEREKARQAGDVEKVKSLDSRISTVSGDIKLLSGSSGTTPSRSTPKPQTELQQNQQAIAKLTEEYQKLATSAKTADEAQQAGIGQRMNDIRAEISQLQERNNELKKFAHEAQSVQYPTGSLPQLTRQLKDLQQAQAQALTGTVWQQYQQQIEQTSLQIDALKGKWKAGEVATFTIKTDDSELLQKLRDIANVQIADKTLTVTATDEALPKLREIDGVTISDKTLTITATDEALPKLREIDGVTIADKTLTVTATDEALPKLREIEGVTIADKTLTVTATDEALPKLREIEGVTIADKTLTITATDEALPKLREIEGVTIADKTLTVTATDEALPKLREIEGVQIADKTLTVTATDEALPKLREIEGVTIADKTLTITATDEALPKLREIEGVQIADKTLTITATDEALPKLREIDGVTIADKTLTVTATDEALPKLREIEGVTIADKTLTVTATDEALPKLREIEGVQIADKTLTVTATDEALPKLREIEGVTIADKTMTITATDEALPKLREIEGVTIADKTLTVTADTAEAFSKVQELVSDIEGKEVSIDVKPQAKALPTLDDYRIQAMLEIDAQNTKVDTSTLQTLLADAMKNGIDVSSLGLESIAEQIGKGIDVPTDKWEEIYDGYKELCEQIGAEPIEINFETGKAKGKDTAKAMKSEWTDAASAVQSLGSALQGLEDPAAKVMGIVAQAIATVALTFSKSLAGTVTPWDWIAAAVAGTATMISTITAIKSATKGGFAEGGIVPGNSYSGDLLRTSDYGINSGELILSMSQQDALANRLTENESDGGVTALPFVTGEKIVLGVNNWGRRTGRGELVFSKM